MGLEGAVPAEDIADAGRAFARAALSEKPIRDLATTRAGTINYAVVKLLPRGVLDRLTLWRMRQLARKGHFDGGELSRDFGAAMRA